ncbi:MAG: hypothetical protein Q8O92_06735 [Candidatus Latescibacter sp.]|nr:hypothetical protein [Candidatus Latescibacter sp.]
MSKLLTDTHPKAEEFQISLLRRASVAERLSLTRSLSRTVIQLSRRAIARANPGLSKQERDIAFVVYHYGNDLAERLRKYLNRKVL